MALRLMESRCSRNGTVDLSTSSSSLFPSSISSKGESKPRTSNRKRPSRKEHTYLQEVNLRVQDSDGKFFENFTSLYWKLENVKRHFNEAGTGHHKNKQKQEIQDLTIKLGQMGRLGQRELDELYVEVLYTIRHKLGVATNTHTAIAEDLFNYAKNAFRISEYDHNRLSVKASQEKPPVLVLNAVVIEAQDLIGKDANGLSDPYCMMGIVPGKRRHELNNSDQRLTSPPDSNKDLLRLSPGGPEDRLEKRTSSFVKRFGGSFRRRSASKDTAIPAKFIRATSVQRASLHPRWNEKFQFDLEDIQSDRFHLDIWDHDDEYSVVEAVKKLNEVSSMKGLSRYFKQVAQSARSGEEDNVDDFLGSVNLSLNHIPSTGKEDWYELEGRSIIKQKVRGRIRLRMWLGTREEKPGQDEDDNLVDVKQHEFLIRIFSEYDLRTSYPHEPWKWSGTLSQLAQTILHQHAIQGDITSVQQCMCHWLACSKIHLEMHLNYQFLYRLLQDLLSSWVPTSLDKDEEDMLAESFSEFLSHCYGVVVRHREDLSVWDKQTKIRVLEEMLRCLTLLHSSDLFRKCMPFQKQLTVELPSLIKKSALAFYERAKHKSEKGTKLSGLSRLSHLIAILNAGCTTGRKIYHEPFYKTANVNYFLIIYKEFDRMLGDRLNSMMFQDILNELVVAADLHSELPTTQQEALLPVFELYLALSEFFSFRQYIIDNEKAIAHLYAFDYGSWFESSINRWMSLSREKALARVDYACQLDKRIESAKTDVQQSTSYVDICHTLQQIIEFWDRLDVPDLQKNTHLTEQLVQNICKIAEYYADKVFAFLAHTRFYDDREHHLSENTVNQVCVTLNDTEHVRRIVKDLPDKLRFEDLTGKLAKDKSTQVAKQWHSTVEHLVDSCARSMSGQIEMALDKLVEKSKDTLGKHLFHLAWSPQGCCAELAAKPLLEQLDSYLIDYHRWFLHRNFVRLLFSLLKLLLNGLRAIVDENPGEPCFYRRLFEALSILIDFFHAGGKGVSLDHVYELKLYQGLHEILSLNQTSTVELIDQHYNDLLKEQDEVTEFKYGILNIRAYYNVPATTLVVDVISAKNVIPLDPNGLSDPFVIVELVPPAMFPQCQPTKTRIIYKTLNPVFDETFEFAVKPSVPSTSMLHFIVMDHDFLVSNDFAGEAFLDLADVPGFPNSSVPSTLRQFNLVLMHPAQKDITPFNILESRKEIDKEAAEFVRHIETVRNT